MPHPVARNRSALGSIKSSRRDGARRTSSIGAITPAGVGEDAANVMRQALAGMLWSKQFFFFDVNKWLQEHGVDPMRPTRQVRNREWFHVISGHVISMPDKWEYPWFAAWDLAFHTIALATVDVDFAKQRLRPVGGRALPAPDRADPGL